MEFINRQGTLQVAVIAGADASMAAQSIVVAGAAVGDTVVGVFNLTDSVATADLNASFEDTITVAGQIQQTATNLAADTHILLLLQRGGARNAIQAFLVDGVDASMAAQSIVSAGRAIGDRVIAALRVTDAQVATNQTANFEGVISVAGQIQQTSGDLSAAAFNQILVLTQRGDFSFPANGVEFVAKGLLQSGVATAGNGAGARAVAPANTNPGQAVRGVVRKETGDASTSVAADFQTAITVAGQIQQTQTNLTNDEVLVFAQSVGT